MSVRLKTLKGIWRGEDGWKMEKASANCLLPYAYTFYCLDFMMKACSLSDSFAFAFRAQLANAFNTNVLPYSQIPTNDAPTRITTHFDFDVECRFHFMTM